MNRRQNREKEKARRRSRRAGKEQEEKMKRYVKELGADLLEKAAIIEKIYQIITGA